MYDGKKERQRESGPGTRKETQIRRRTYEQTRKEKRRRNRGFGIERERKTRVRVGRGTQKENERVKYCRDDLQLRDREREREQEEENEQLGPYRRAHIYDAANTLYTLFCLHAKYRLTVTLSNEIKGGHPSLFLFVRKRGATHRGTSTWPTTPLHSLTRHGRATGAFLFTRATSCSNFVFLSCPSPPSASFFLSSFLSSFLFLSCCCSTRPRPWDYATHNGEI